MHRKRWLRQGASSAVALAPLFILSACTISPITAPAASLAAAGAEVLIPAGPFQMGCGPADGQCAAHENPLHEVRLDAYFIDRHEVTNARYQACVEAGVCTPPYATASATREVYYGNPEFADYPVVNVDWPQADAFCAWEGKRLPSEAEWEKAARGSEDARTYPWGDGAPDKTLLNFDSNVGDTTAVGSYPDGRSPYGVMDMSGNVWEWVSDWYQADAYALASSVNPTGPASGEFRVLRGGSWLNDAPFERATVRVNAAPETWYIVDGFRCARTP